MLFCFRMSYCCAYRCLSGARQRFVGPAGLVLEGHARRGAPADFCIDIKIVVRTFLCRFEVVGA